ncbi:MAG: hypothetical protein ABSG81_12015 [Acidimicrobiales bacterium]|jgi:hypothetical protein
MAVGVQLDFLGATLEQYDAINEIIGRLPGGPAAAHEVFHLASPTEDGFRVIDVWESTDAFDQFLRERLTPAFEEVAVPNPPSITTFEIHDFAVGSRRET